MKRYEFIDHTADIAIKAYGADFYQALEECGRAFFDIITENSSIKHDKKISFTIGADDQEALVVSFLSQLILFFELDNFVLGKFEVEPLDQFSVRCVAYGEKFDNNKHDSGSHIKGVSYHMLRIEENQNETSIQVLFDV